MSPDLVETCINTIRVLIVDSVNNAGAGHPGAAMGLAPVGFVVWDEAMRYNPANPNWFNRDRFVLSVGHASLLQYTLLHLTGFDMQVGMGWVGVVVFSSHVVLLVVVGELHRWCRLRFWPALMNREQIMNEVLNK